MKLLFILMMTLLLFGYVIFLAIERALLSLSVFQIAQLKEAEGKHSKILRIIANRFDRMLIAVLILNKLLIFSIFIGVGVFIELLGWNLSIITLILIAITAITLPDLLIAGVAQRKPVETIRYTAYPLLLFYVLLFPITYLITKLLGKNFRKQTASISLEELSDVIENSDLSNAPDQDEANLLKGVVRFSDIEAKSVMKERIIVTAIEKNSPTEKVLQIITESGYSRFPVYEENLDRIVGILVLKDLLPIITGAEKTEWQTKIRPAFFVEETAKIDDLLPTFQSKKNHFAIVVDEYGGTSGIITLEDILEEIVGEIGDESDTLEEEQIGHKVADNQWDFEANTSINDFCKVLNLEEDFFETAQGEAESLGGLMLELCGTFPEIGKKVEYQHLTFTITATDDRRILQINVVTA